MKIFVQIDLEQMKLVQSRGLMNKNTEYHERIKELIENNINVIKKCRKRRIEQQNMRKTAV